MVTDRAEDLRTIMSDNATFIQFPPLGSSTSLITVYGDHRVNIQRTIRSIMQLVSQKLYSDSEFSLTLVAISLGLPILCRFLLVVASPVQRTVAACKSQSFNDYCFA